MFDPEQPSVLSVRELHDVIVIDGGGTLAVQLQDAQGRTLHILLPAKLAERLSTQLAEAGVKANNQRNGNISN
ncbi:hypothetical protein JNW90_13285 [Micromonospora sp. STR1s_5]|nr:hypothetical protein [Micromonospora sp. STR1s_5]